MPFHRLAIPSYFEFTSGGLPSGYDYINNATVGTPATADAPRASGPSAGTYFVGFGEDGRSFSTNRGLKALAENTDLLDNLLRRDLTVQQVTLNALSGGGGVTSIVLSNAIFVGQSGTPNTAAGIRTFITLVDADDNEIYNAGTEVAVTSITGATPGDVWSSTSGITLNISPAIPPGTTYRVFYWIRGSLATQTDDAHQRRPSARRWNGGVVWADASTNPANSITGQLDKIVGDLAATTGAAKVGAAAVAGSPLALSSGSVRTQLDALLVALNSANAMINNLLRLRTITTTATLHSPAVDGTLIINPAANFNLQLPSPASYTGYPVYLLNGTGTMSPTNRCTLVRFGSELINGQPLNFELNVPLGRWKLISDGTNWHLE